VTSADIPLDTSVAIPLLMVAHTAHAAVAAWARSRPTYEALAVRLAHAP
jgi:hypothetical protein